MYEMLGACLFLAAWLVLYAGATLISVLCWRSLAPRASQWSHASRAQTLLLLRVAPFLVSILCVLSLLVPAYLIHEPRDTSEAVTVYLGLLAGISICGIGWAAWKGVRRGLATSRLVREWMKHARPLQLADVPIPAYRLPHPFPILAIVGAIHPRLFVADRVFEALSDEEIAAAVTHEAGHFASRDTFKHGLLQVCRDLLAFIPFGRALDRAWVEAAEAAADEYAARRGTAVALNLASALVKVARHIPPGVRPASLAGAFFMAEHRSRITTRVMQLTCRTGLPDRTRAAGVHALNRFTYAGLSLMFLGSLLAVFNSGLIAKVYAALETIVTVLQ